MIWQFCDELRGTRSRLFRRRHLRIINISTHLKALDKIRRNNIIVHSFEPKSRHNISQADAAAADASAAKVGEPGPG